MKKGEKICFVVSLPGTARAFLRHHIDALSRVYYVSLVANFKNGDYCSMDEICECKTIGIERKISPIKDVIAIFQLSSFLKKGSFVAVHSVTPKAGFVTALAARIAGVPHRIHIFTGQVWVTKTGLKRWLLKTIDRLIFKFDNHFLADSHGQRAFLIKEGFVSENLIKVLGPGSISGVDVAAFSTSNEKRLACRNSLSLREGDIVFVFLGRLNTDKGINELLQAFKLISKKYDNTWLLLIGEDENDFSSKLSEGNNILYVGHTGSPQDFLRAGDVFCLPSYREGFGNSVIEASALGLPVICSDIYGLQDAMLDGITGLRCHPGDVSSLYGCMEELVLNPSLRKQLGDAGRLRVLNEFQHDVVTSAWGDYYRDL